MQNVTRFRHWGQMNSTWEWMTLMICCPLCNVKQSRKRVFQSEKKYFEKKCKTIPAKIWYMAGALTHGKNSSNWVKMRMMTGHIGNNGKCVLRKNNLHILLHAFYGNLTRVLTEFWIVVLPGEVTPQTALPANCSNRDFIVNFWSPSPESTLLQVVIDMRGVGVAQ